MRTWAIGLGLMGAAIAASIPAQAATSTFTGTVTGTTDYMFRGISQTDGHGTVQGSLEWNHTSGIFLGVWASGLDFPADPDAEVEIDFYGGYKHAITDKTTATLKFIYYHYPDAFFDESNYFEAMVGLSHNYDWISVSASAFYSPDYFFESGDGVFLTAGASIPATSWISVSGNVGYQWIDENPTFGTPDYLTWDFGVTLTYEFATLDVRWIDTDLEENECFGTTDLCDGRIVATLSFAHSVDVD